MSLRAVDARYLLPLVPRTARVVGDLPEWREGLRIVGVDILGSDSREEPDVLVAPAELAASSLDIPARTYLFLGRPAARAARLKGLAATTYLAIPDLATPEYLVPVRQRRTMHYFYDRIRISPVRARWFRNRLAARLIGLGMPLSDSGQVTVVTATNSSPAALLSAGKATNRDADGWLLSLGPPHAERRVVFSVFRRHCPVPEWVAKVERLPRPEDAASASQSDENMARLIAIGALVSEHVPHPLGEAPFAGGIETIETAAAGYILTDFLRGPFRRARKLSKLDGIASWLVDVARATAQPVEGEPVGGPRSTSPEGSAAPEAGALSGLPSVLEHGDLWSNNIIIGPGRSFTVIDWADSDRHGLPLRDLLYFLSESLAVVDGASTDAERDRHFGALFRGELPTSAILFGWIRTMVASLEIDRELVGRLAAHCWDDLAIRREKALATTPAPVMESMGADAIDPAIRKAELWRQDPGLGDGWSAWGN